MKAQLKRVAPARARRRYGELRYWASRAVPAVRNGVGPVSFVRHHWRGNQRLRFQGVEVQNDNGPLAWTLAREIAENAEYDFPGFVPEFGWRVIDVGANIGLFSMLAASRGASVTSYEPHPGLFRHLMANTSRWGVDCHQAAVVGAPVESVPLHAHLGRDIRSSVLGKDIIDGHALEPSFDVPAVAIADVLADGCDLLKVDIEGGEFEVFARADETLRRTERIVAEIHGGAGDPRAAVRAIEVAGFEVTLYPTVHDAPIFPLTATRK